MDECLGKQSVSACAVCLHPQVHAAAAWTDMDLPSSYPSTSSSNSNSSSSSIQSSSTGSSSSSSSMLQLMGAWSQLSQRLHSQEWPQGSSHSSDLILNALKLAVASLQVQREGLLPMGLAKPHC